MTAASQPADNHRRADRRKRAHRHTDQRSRRVTADRVGAPSPADSAPPSGWWPRWLKRHMLPGYAPYGLTAGPAWQNWQSRRVNAGSARRLSGSPIGVPATMSARLGTERRSSVPVHKTTHRSVPARRSPETAPERAACSAALSSPMIDLMRHRRTRLWWRGPRRGWYWSVTRHGRGIYGIADSFAKARSAIRAAKADLAVS